MEDALVVGVVIGVTPDKWARAWRERMPDVPLRVRAITDAEAGAALLDTANMVLARLPLQGVDPAELHVISLWDELPMVVAAKDHPIKVFDTLTLAEIADEELYPGWDDPTLDIVAAGHGIARMPQSVLRATGRRDVIGRPISDAEPTRIGLVWRRDSGSPSIDEFVGIVRGRKANSSRGAPTPPDEPVKPARPAKTDKTAKSRSARPKTAQSRRKPGRR